MNNLIPFLIIAAVTLTVVILLFWKNNKDKKLMNPDATDAVDEMTANQKRKKDRI